MGEARVITFRATEEDMQRIEAIMAAQSSKSVTDTIRLALKVAPQSLVAKLEGEIQRQSRAAEELRRLIRSAGSATEAAVESVEGEEEELRPPFSSFVPAVDELTAVFMRVIQPARVMSFGSEPLGKRGISDGNDGVQWNAWVDLRTEDAWLGVNLEGLKYRNWPIADLILRELEEPGLIGVIARVERPADVTVLWRRDAWQGGGRLPYFKEHVIGEVPLDQLTEPRWRADLREALACLDKARNYRGRALREVTLRDGSKVEREVSPHLQFRTRLWTGRLSQGERLERMTQALSLLPPLYEFIAARTTD